MRFILEGISLVCRLGLALLFLYASWDKVWDPAAFAVSVAQYDVLPLWAVNSLSALLAWLELWLGLFLLMGIFTRAAALWACLLLALFTGLMIYAGLTGAGYDCGCFPGQAEGHTAGFDAALRDAGLLLAAVWVLVRPGRWLSLEGLFGRRGPGGLSFEDGFPPRLK